uniref:universal stress protein Sll1388-like n=1 Tax=Styela clava TaxID=7725 RepID=UPI00193A5606|nr:universal stress protein Sll1388-like [Styela clava]
MTGTTNSKFRVVICVDDSEHSERAFEFYVKHINKPENHIILMHVAEIGSPDMPFIGPGAAFAIATLMEQQFAESKIRVNEIKRHFEVKCDQLKLKHVFVALAQSSCAVGESIVGCARKKEANFFVMGSRGRGTLRRTFLGSVSDYVLHHSHLPTLICPPVDD